MAKISGIVFDKDGTLYDFNATWGAWAESLLISEVQGDMDRVAPLAAALGYDLENKVFLPGSIVIAETVPTVAERVLPLLPETTLDALVSRMNRLSSGVPQIEAAPLVPFVESLKSRDIKIGVCTNDAERPARDHLASSGVETLFDFVAGYDSGYGAKPAPGPLLGFCNEVRLSPSDCVMVGDSLHDLEAGRAAGMMTVGVLTGPASADDLAPLADAVLPSIAVLADWLDQLNR